MELTQKQKEILSKRASKQKDGKNKEESVDVLADRRVKELIAADILDEISQEELAEMNNRIQSRLEELND